MIAPAMHLLDFKPLTSPPDALPTCTWNGLQLWKSSMDLAALDLSAMPFDKALKSVYPSLLFTELCEIVERTQNLKASVDLEQLFTNYQFRYDKKMRKTMDLFWELPISVKNWARNHDLSPKDLYPLCALSNINTIFTVLEKMISLRPTRSQGAQAIELLAECALLEKTNWDPQTENMSDWITQLHTLRYPQAIARDNDRQKTMLSGWTKMFSTRWLRLGDRSGVEVKFFIGSKKELSEKISTLSRIHDGWSDDER
jgi:hypothetical protein